MKNESLVPELRFPEYSEENEDNTIKKFQFDELFNFSTGKNIKQKEASPEFDIPCVRYGELYHMYKEVIYEIINRTNLDRKELLFSKGDEILLPSAGEDPLDIGSASALTIKNVAIGRTINILRPKDESLYSPIFVSYYINQKLKRKISSLAKGVSISNVYNSDLKKLEIQLPSLKEQQKIASLLTTIDKRTKLIEEKKTKLEQYKKGVMQQLFNQDIRFKDDDGNDFPDWEERRISEEFNVIKPDRVSEGLLPYLEIGDIDTSTFTYKLKNKRTVKGAINVPKDTLLISTVRPNLNKIVVTNEALNVSNAFATIFLSNSYLFHFLTTDTVNDILVRHSEGGTYPTINKETIYSLKFYFPSNGEQKRIASFLSMIDEQIKNIDNQRAFTIDFKKGLLQKMFV